MKQRHENHDSVHGGYRALLGRLPYGYRWNKEKGRLEVEPNEAGIYHWMVRMYVERGMSFRDIAIKLRGHGVKCKRAEWSKVTVSYILKNPVYCGRYKVKLDKSDGKPGALGADSHKRRDPVESYINYPIPPLISNEYWKMIQEKIDCNRTKSKPGSKIAEFFLRDVLKCGRCGASVKPRVGSVRKDGTAPRYYTCYWAGTSRKNIEAEVGRTKCTLPFLKAEDVENVLWQEIIKKVFMKAQKGSAKLLAAQQYKKDIANFSPCDRRVFVEGVLYDDITVDSHEDPENHGAERPVVDFMVKWNQALWQRFIEEGKI